MEKYTLKKVIMLEFLHPRLDYSLPQQKLHLHQLLQVHKISSTSFCISTGSSNVACAIESNQYGEDFVYYLRTYPNITGQDYDVDLISGSSRVTIHVKALNYPENIFLALKVIKRLLTLVVMPDSISIIRLLINLLQDNKQVIQQLEYNSQKMVIM